MNVIDIIQMLASVVTAIASIFILIVVYGEQVKHENKLLKKDKILRQLRQFRQQELRHQAQNFLIDNIDEIQYLPLCVVAANVSKISKHSRKIYSNFCKLPAEVMDIVLEEAHEEIRIDFLPQNEWIQGSFDKLMDDAVRYKLGVNVSYDVDKYFTRAKNYMRMLYPDLQSYQKFPMIFKPIYYKAFRQSDEYINIVDYVDDYMQKILSNENLSDANGNELIPPITYVWETMGAIKYKEEDYVCAWTVTLIHAISLSLCRRVYKNPISIFNQENIETVFLEDMYYKTLLELFLAYNSPARIV